METRGSVFFGDDRYKLFEVGKKTEVKYASMHKLAYIRNQKLILPTLGVNLNGRSNIKGVVL